MRQAEFDSLLPARHIIVESARVEDLCGAADLAKLHMPELELSDLEKFERLIRFDPECIQLFRRDGRLVGLFAMLLLNSSGIAALLQNNLVVQDPPIQYLALPEQEPAAIYASLVVCPGQAVQGIGSVSKKLRQPRFVAANIYARPISDRGRRLMRRVGFERIPSEHAEIHRYVRLSNCAEVSKVGTSKGALI